MRARVELSVVELPRTLARLSQLLAHRFGVIEELTARRTDGAGGIVTVVLDGPEARVEFLITHFRRLVGVTAVQSVPDAAPPRLPLPAEQLGDACALPGRNGVLETVLDQRCRQPSGGAPAGDAAAQDVDDERDLNRVGDGGACRQLASGQALDTHLVHQPVHGAAGQLRPSPRNHSHV